MYMNYKKEVENEGLVLDTKLPKLFDETVSFT